MYVGGFTQSIGDTCSGKITSVQDLLLASVPEFVGGLLVALVTAAAAWSIRKRRKHYESVGAEGDQRS
ncbi:hypothetical protein ACWDG9_34845 [Streptomyces sp. NPDC001073]